MLVERGVRLARLLEVIERARVLRLDRGDASRRFEVRLVLIANPDIERRPPKALPGERPVDVVREEIAEAPLLDVVGEPLTARLFAIALIDELRRADVPGGAGVLDERVVIGAPAERVVVTVVLRVDEETAFLQS